MSGKALGAAASLLVLGALAVGCGTLESSNDRVNPDKPLWYSRPSGALRVVFKRDLTAGSQVVGEAYEKGRAEIDPIHGRLFIGTADHGLYALRTDDGSTIWRFETLAAVQSEPLYDPDLDLVYFGSNDGALYAVHAFDGKLAWRFASGAEIGRRPVVVGEMLYFANGADNLFAVDRRTGKSVWHVHRTPALGMEVSGYGGPAYDNGMVFFPYSDGHVGAYDARDGNERWIPVDLSAEAEQAQGGQTVRYLDVDTTPVPHDLGPAGKVVYVASYAGGVYALDQERGAPVWKNDRAVGVTELTLWREPDHMPRPGTPEYAPGGPPLPAREILFASSGSTGLWALDPASGKVLWRLPLPDGGITAPVTIAGALLVGTTRYGAFLLSPRNGGAIDGFDLGTGFSQTPAAYGHRGFLMSNAGTLLAVQAELPRAADSTASAGP